MTDAMQEASETQCWLEFSLACGYIDAHLFSEFDNEYDEIILMLNSMEKKASKFRY
ncbi:four helix bundle protein [candidate division WOR-3 bacterium]|nr:four helix bundle protein [candidate division WOR-3 bacterium]